MFDRTTRLFLRYRDRGDTAALAAVFDRTALELLGLALHLCRDLGDAEDLLQATFLAAIESAPRFERGKRVLPWLTGILVHRAHSERRRRARTGVIAGGAAIDPDQLAASAQGPLELAAGRELGAGARSAIEGLAEPFRQVMLLRFVHGMEPGEIALLLRRSPGTVRGQLHRGLERLRGSLPRAVATALAATATTAGRGLAAVRAAVLTEAGRTVAVTAAGSTVLLTATIAMTKKILLLTLATAGSIALGVWAWPEAAPAPANADGGALTAAPERSGDAAIGPPPAAGSAMATSSTAVAERTPAPSPADAPTWPIEVVVIDGATGAALADAAVELHGPRVATLLELQREFADAAPPGWTGVPTGGPELGALRDLPIEVVAGGEARALLVPPRDGAEPLVRGTTDIDGRCRLRAPASGAFLVVRDRGYGIGRLLLDEAPGAELQVTLWPLRRLAGVVRTTDGEVPPVPLRLRLCDRLSVWFADTDARGRFEVEVAADTVEVQCATPGWTTARSYRDPTTGRDMIGRREFPAGDDTNVYVAPYGATRLHVTDAVTGKPIEVIGLIATDDNGYPRRCGQFVAPGGWLALDVPRDLQQLVDQPEMASYRAMRAATLTVFAAGYASALLRDVPFAGEQPAAIEVPLAPGDCGELAGFVTRAGGAVADARVQLRPLPPLQWDGGDRMVFATRRSAADGGFEFAAPAGDYIVEVFVEDQCALQQQVAVPASGPVTLDLAACVWVDVFVVDARGAPVAGHNAMVGAGIGQRGIGRTGDDGHVGFGPFPAGRLHARAPRIASETSWAAAVEVEFTAAAGERPEITLRLPSDELVRPVLTFDGPAPADGFAGFTVRQRGGSDTEAVPVGDDGAVPIALLPGEGRLAVDAPGGRTWDFTLPADARDGHVLALRWRGLGYAGIAVDETGTPIAGCQLQATPIGRGPRVTVRTGSDGAFRLDGLEPCEYRLSIPDRPRYSQDKLFPRQLWTPLAPPATEPPRLRPEFHRGDGDLLRGCVEFTLFGRLVDTDGAPIVKAIAGISTIIEQEGGVLEIWPRPAWFYTDADGGFVLQVVRGDRYRTQFGRKVGAPTTRREVALAADRAEVRQEFVLR